MTDFTQYFGEYTLKISDTGSGNTNFFIYITDQSNHVISPIDYRITVDGYVNAYSYGIPAYAGWFFIASISATYTQFVTLELYNPNNPPSGGGLPSGFPQNSLTVHILRDTPGTANAPVTSNPKINAMDVYLYAASYAGSAPIINYQLGYGTTPGSPTSFSYFGVAPITLTISNLAMGTTYYFQYRAQNANGWGEWSPYGSGRTYNGAYVNVGGVWKIAIPYVKSGGIWKQAEPTVTHI